MSVHWTKTGTCRQTFEITADVSLLIDYLTDKILESVQDKEFDIDFDESYVDVDKLVIKGSYDTPYSWTHYDATRLDPPEDDVERSYLGDVTPDPEISEDLKKLIKDIVIEEDEDDAEYGD